MVRKYEVSGRRTRKFAGRVHRLFSVHNTKKQAYEAARRLRRGKYYRLGGVRHTARIIKAPPWAYPGRWWVYARRR